MPLDVRNELLTEIEPQAVECFIRGIFPFRNTDFGTLADPPSPPLFTEWYQNLRMTYPPLSKDIQELKVSLDSLPVDYPM
jgi:hypothetical protein